MSQGIAFPKGPVVVSIPATLGNDFEKMNKITKDVLGRLGCAGCHSGFDLRFQHEREFVFNAKAEMVRGM